MKMYVTCLLCLALVAAVWLSGSGQQHAIRELPPTQPAGIDLDVTYISRTPTYHRYCVVYPDGVPQLCSGTEGEQRWPNPGEQVTFTAHIVNKGTDPSGPFSCTWFIDGAPVHTDIVPGLAAGAEIAVAYAWTWPHDLDGERLLGQHTVGFTADSLGAVAETFESNNHRTDRTDALSLAIFFEQSLYDELEGAVNGVGTYSSEDWIQWQVAQMNERLTQAVYPTSPQGVLSRVRIDYIEVCVDVPACMATHDERAQDGRWQFFYTPDYVRRFAARIDWGLVHELAHQIGVIDLYRLNVEDWMNQVPDLSGDPLLGSIYWPNGGLMGGGDTAPHDDSTYLSSHTAAGLNSNHGYRRGYYGDYLFDVPLTTTLVTVDSTGEPVEDAEVALFQRPFPEQILLSTPVIAGRTNGAGELLLPDRSAQGHTTTATGHTLRDTPFGYLDVVGTTGIFWGRVRARGHEEFFRYDITDANLAYWAGLAATHRITLTTHIPPPGAPTAPPRLQVLCIEHSQVTLAWSPSPSGAVSGYNVYRASWPDWIHRRVVTSTTTLSYTETLFSRNQYHYAVTAVDSLGLESGFSPVARVPLLIRPWGIAITPEGDRVIAENHYRRALLQHGDGRFVGFFSRLSRFSGAGLDVGDDGAILVAEPARNCVHYLDAAGNVLGTIGICDSAPGQLSAPYDAAFARPGVPPEPQEPDAHTLLLCPFDDGTTCVAGEVGAGAGTTLAEGRFDQGVLVTGTATLTYPTASNIVPAQGTIEFWLQPGWDGDDPVDHALVETSGGWFNRIRIASDSAGNLRFFMWDGANEYLLAHHIGHWQAGEWHHVAAVWSSDSMWLVVDGVAVAQRASLAPVTLGDTLYVGSGNSGWHQAGGVLDDLRVSDIPRLVNAPLAFVADTGRHQVQAVGGGLEMLVSFGGYGSSPGQFSGPQGIAAMPGGRVIVADTGNSRIQVLHFDGSAFTVSQIITTGLAFPRDVAVDGLGQIAVADSGNNLVRLFDADGALLATFDRPDLPYTGGFRDPGGVAIERPDRIVVSDTGNRRVVTVTLRQQVYLPTVLMEHEP